MEDYESVSGGGAVAGAVVVSKDLEGNLSVEQTDHMVEEGAAGLAGVGFVVGLFAPPLLAATAIGAAVGAVGGRRPSTRRPEARSRRLPARRSRSGGRG